MYQRLGKAAYKANLDNTWLLADYLDHPERGFKSIHVAGTNGKGSTSHMLASVLQSAGYKVGLYTSPHLKDLRERIRINGAVIDEAAVVDFVAKHKSFFEAHQLSFFEMTVGMAFDYFLNQQVDIAVVEVGLGGRLDSTNILTPELSVITNIGLDHTQFLGDTLDKIAGEKAGIIKPGVPVVIGEAVAETQPVFDRIARECEAPIVYAQEISMKHYPCDLIGQYQQQNQQTALVALDQFQQLGWKLNKTDIEHGLAHVAQQTGLMGRWQQLQSSPRVICDTAHNAEGLSSVMAQLEEQSFEQLHMVIGMVNDKNLSKVLGLFPGEAIYYFCAAQIQRALPADELASAAQEKDLNGQVYASVEEAYRAALEAASPVDLIYVGGSTFVVAEVL